MLEQRCECPSIIPCLNCSWHSGQPSEPSPQYIDYGGIFNVSKFSCMLKFKNRCLLFGWNCSFHWLGCICFRLLFVPPLNDATHFGNGIRSRAAFTRIVGRRNLSKKDAVRARYSWMNESGIVVWCLLPISTKIVASFAPGTVVPGYKRPQ